MKHVHTLCGWGPTRWCAECAGRWQQDCATGRSEWRTGKQQMTVMFTYLLSRLFEQTELLLACRIHLGIRLRHLQSNVYKSAHVAMKRRVNNAVYCNRNTCFIKPQKHINMKVHVATGDLFSWTCAPPRASANLFKVSPDFSDFLPYFSDIKADVKSKHLADVSLKMLYVVAFSVFMSAKIKSQIWLFYSL